MVTQMLRDFDDGAESAREALLFKRILLIESDPQFIDEIRDFLDLHFFEVKVATGPVEAIQELIGGEFDLIVCDLTMPNFPIEMFFKAVCQTQPRLAHKIISITDSLEIARQRINPGAVSIWKPLDVRVLLEAIQTVLKKDKQAVSSLAQISKPPVKPDRAFRIEFRPPIGF